MADWGGAFYDHFVEYLGEPVDREIYAQDEESPSIQILQYEDVFEDCIVFASLGLSKYASEQGGYREVCLVTDDAFEESETILANTLFYAIGAGLEIGQGVSISGVANIDPEFARKYDKHALYFTLPFAFPDGYEKLEQLDGYVYWAFFISQKEHEFFVTNGAEAFENLLEEQEVDPFDIKRPSML